MKKAIYLFLSLAIIILSAMPVYAHPGGTDSSGGHYDSETGGYHYHHGYPAHSHYDMDGDGDIDCPFDFEDLTKHDYYHYLSTEPEEDGTFHNKEISDNLPTDHKSKLPISEIFENLPGIAAVVALILLMLSWALCIFSEDAATSIMILAFKLFGIAAILMVIWTIVLGLSSLWK